MAAIGRGKNIERMEEAVPGLDYQGVQQFIADSPWAWGPVMAQAAQGVDELLGGHPGSQLLIDETAFGKKGDKSVGVARQYNGRLGKVDNCQVAVFAALGCGDRAALIGARLYLPEEWSRDPARCRRAGIPPADQRFAPKTELALELVAEQRALGVRFGWVNVDAGYGKDPAFLRALDDLGETFVAGVHASQRFWADCLWPAVPLPGGRGRTAKRPRAVGQAVSVAAWTAAQPPAAWPPMALRAGTKGEVRVEFLHARVYLWDGQEPTPRLWHLVGRRALDAKGPAPGPGLRLEQRARGSPPHAPGGAGERARLHRTQLSGRQGQPGPGGLPGAGLAGLASSCRPGHAGHAL